MGSYRKNVRIQLLLFVAFLLLGLNILAGYYLEPIASWYAYIPLGIVLVLIIWGVLIFRSKDTKIIEMSQQEFKRLRTSLYAYFVVYVIDIVLESSATVDQLLLSIVVTVILSAISIYGIVLHLNLLKRG